MEFWKNRKVLVTGGAGFLGTYLVKRLKEKKCKKVFVPRSKDYDLVRLDAVKKLYRDSKPDIVVHLAAKVGGIGLNRAKPAELFYKNLMMGAQMMEEGRLSGIEKFVAIGTACSYPKAPPAPFKEKDIWNGYPEETNASYALAKKVLLVQCQSYRKQYGFNSIYLISTNLYGPGDNIDLETSHVIPALIRKCFDAIKEKRDEIVVWGTGNVTREFLYVDDCAEAIILAAEKYEKEDPVNIGSGIEISVKDLVKLIMKLTGFKGKVVWDSSKPDGQPRKFLDISRAKEEFGFSAKTGLIDGLKKTIAAAR